MPPVIPSVFFLNGELHRTEKIVKSQNWVVAFNYPQEKRMQYNLSFVKKSYQKAFRTRDLSRLLRYNDYRLRTFIERKMVTAPSGRAYSISSYKPGAVYWSEDDVLDLRERLYDLEPKRNGYPRNGFNLISHAELVSVFRGDPSYYIQNNNGEMIKVWKSFI